MQKMTREECEQFIMEKARPAIAAVVRLDGRPHVTPIWIEMDGDQIVFTTARDSIKGKALLRDPRIALSIDDDEPPFSFVTVDGVTSISEDLADLKQWAARIGGRYMWEDQAEAYGQRNGVEGELLVRVTARRMTGARDVAGW